VRLDKPHTLALILAGAIGAFSFVLLLVLRWDGMLPTLDRMLLSSLAITGLAYFLIRLAVAQFIYNKVKIIYKNIHELKVGDEAEEEEVVRSSDLDMVTLEVTEWASQRRQEIRELQERENFRREFIGNISHELKTPVFNIQGYLLTLLDGALDDPEINRKYLKRANKSVDRMINIIEDLEVISDLESNRVQLNLSHYDIVQQVREVFELMEETAAERRLKLELKAESERLISVHADRAKIEQVLINLIGNAIKYGNEEGRVSVSFFDMDQNILIEVSDDGIGIPEDDLPRVFERFYRVDKSRSREAGGTGLGLAIVKHIVEAHKQSINVRSSENVGSTFYFTLKKGR